MSSAKTVYLLPPKCNDRAGQIMEIRSIYLCAL